MIVGGNTVCHRHEVTGDPVALSCKWASQSQNNTNFRLLGVYVLARFTLDLEGTIMHLPGPFTVRVFGVNGQ